MSPNELVIKHLKDLASEHLSQINVFRSSKHRSNNGRNTINLFLHEYEINWSGINLNQFEFESDLKS